MNIYLFFAFVLLFTFLVGRLVEKVRIPWIFAALLLGFLLAIKNPFPAASSSEAFDVLAHLGMYSLLFMIGFELDLGKMKKSGAFIVRATAVIISLEAVCGSLLIHFVFGYGWFISFLVAMSFATVGEAILFPILDEFGIINTKLGQAIIGIGTLDDIVEILALVLLVFVVGPGAETAPGIGLVLGSLFALLVLTYGLARFKAMGRKFMFLSSETLFLFVLFVFFLFIGVGQYAHASAIGALCAGAGLRVFVPEERFALIKSEVKTMCYGFLAPMFFVWVGMSLDIAYLVTAPLLVLLVVAVSKGAKLLGSYVVARKELGGRQSVLLGIGLSVRFSTSIVIITILFENGLVGPELYSVIVASSMAFKFIVPVLFANLLVRWKVAGAR